MFSIKWRHNTNRIVVIKNGVWVAGAEFVTTSTVSNWTAFNIPISQYVDADSATIVLAAFYNDTTCGFPAGPFGNSTLYVDNISFDNLITSVSDLKETNTLINIYPNPASDFITFSNEYNEDIDVKIYSISGALIKSETLSKSNYNLDVKHL